MTKQQQKKTAVYLQDEASCWVPALQLEARGNKAKIIKPIFKTENQIMQCGKVGKQKYTREETIDLSKYPNQCLPLQNVDTEGNLEDYKDMVELCYMHEAAILYNLKKRHMQEKPYTRTGDIVIAVNPYQWYDELYTEKKRSYYSNRLVWDSAESDPRGSMEPHVYEVSALSYRGLAFEDEDQSILVSGESGAGKTETVKICLNHIASTQNGQMFYEEGTGFDPVVQRVVDANPLLEAFGNAKTRRNDNSSRFGKYLQLQFEKGVGTDIGRRRSKLVGSKCEVYLLEKNRVVGHELDERTFHIFYQLLDAPDSVKGKFWNRLVGAKKDAFAYVGPSNTDTIEGIKDGARFQHTLDSLQEIGVTDDKAIALMKAICMVMQLGNIGFSPDPRDSDRSVVSTPDELSALADLMNVSETDLVAAFTERTMQTRNETYKVPLNAKAAKEACNALAKEMYQKTFLWLVDAINEATAVQEKASAQYGTIGLLDIFGFESFIVNRFEQLCINYANEKLQQKFTEDIFRSVQEEYKYEGIPLSEIHYEDNTDVVDLIEGRTGLLAMLNEECIRPKGNDFDFVQKALQQNKGSACLMVHRTDRMSFGISHYAGNVMYDGEFFVKSNQDTLPTDLQSCSAKCNNFIINSSPAVPEAVKVTGKSSNGRRKDSNIVAPTVWTKYKSQLSNLMEALRKTRSRYIRCIKPNSTKEALVMEHKPVVEQLQCAGVIAGITITRSVFPNRLENGIVLARYGSSWDVRAHPSSRTSGMTAEQRRSADCKALLKGALASKVTYENGKAIEAFVVGKTKTYFRAGALEWLEANRMKGLDAQAITLQKYARGWLVRNQGRSTRQRRAQEELDRQRRQLAEQQRLAELERKIKARREEILREKAELQERVARLKAEMKTADRTGDKGVEEMQESARQLRREIADMKDRQEDEHRRLLNEPKTELAQQRKKLDEAGKLIAFLKKENMKVRKNFKKVEAEHDAMMNRSSQILGTNSFLGESFNDLNDAAGRVHSKNNSLTSTRESEMKLNEELRGKVSKVQDMYMGQAQARLELQRCMARVLNRVQDDCKDANIVEEVVVLALQCETEAKSEMVALEVATGEPGLAGSDVSDSEEGSGTFGESWTQ